MDLFEKEVRNKLKFLSEDDKIYLKKNYIYELFQKHKIFDHEINAIFDPKKAIAIYPNAAFAERIDIEVVPAKGRTLKVIIQFDPFVRGLKMNGKLGIITAFWI